MEMDVVAMRPGVYTYRGGTTDPVAPLALGLYGMLIIDPAEGYPTAVDRELALVQSEAYLKPAPVSPGGGASEGLGLDLTAFNERRPSHVLFNGRTDASGIPLMAKPGERVRLFAVNAGVSAPSQLQVLGKNDQVLAGAVLEPGSGAITELLIPNRWKFRLVDRKLVDTGRSPQAILDTTEGIPDAETLAELARAEARKILTPQEKRERGAGLYRERCVQCHEPPPGTARLAPDLEGVMKRHTRDWLVRWLSNPTQMQASDPDAQALMQKWNNLPMPDMLLAPAQVEWLLEFLASRAVPGKKN
jgi:nitrite reductase (NO-forming)